MENKEKFYQALRKNKGRLDEIDLGERIGLDEQETRELIGQLLSEYRISYTAHSTCKYTPIKAMKSSMGKRHTGGIIRQARFSR